MEPLRSTNIPFQLTSFVGREQDLSKLCEMLSSARLVTLAGPAGCGKTRLALEAARDLLPVFPDGVWLTEFAQVIQPSIVIPAVASSLDLHEQPGSSLFETVIESLQRKTLLLLLDNCEHLIGPSAELAERLLSNCSNVTILATSREPLGVRGEHVIRVRPMTFPEPGSGLLNENLLEYDAVRLFVERASTISPDFMLNDSNSTAIVQICHQLDGVPLALELAAGWAGTLATEQIAERLVDRFRLLSGGKRTAAPRQQTLRGAMNWSYDLLNGQEQKLFNRLSVFGGAFTLEATESVVSDESMDRYDVLPLLARLVDTSLLMVESRPAHSRYRLLETLRLYAREQLIRTGESDRFNDAHARYFLELAEAAEPALWGPDLAHWLDKLETEHDNMRAALRWSVGRGEADIAQRLGAALCQFWRIRGHLSDGLRWLEGALSWNAGSSPATRARALDAAGHLARDRGDYGLSDMFYQESLELRRNLGDHRGMALTMNNLGILAQFSSDFETSTAFLAESLRLFRGLTDQRGVAMSLVTLAATVQLSGNYERAGELYAEGLKSFRALDDKRGIAASLNNLANMTSGESATAQTMRYYQESLLLFRELGDQHEVASCLGNLAVVLKDQRDFTGATSLSYESLQIFRILGDKRGLTGCLVFLAKLDAAQGYILNAAKLLGMADALNTTASSSGSTLPSEYLSLVIALGESFETEAFVAARAAGRLITIDALIAGTGLSSTPDPIAQDGPHLLTRRQREVAILISRGLTNRQIAETLFIAERTADTHVENILARLNVESRAQIATWTVENR